VPTPHDGLPRAPRSVAAVRGPHAAYRPTILIVEDDPLFSVALQRFIGKLTARYDILLVTSADAALAELDQRQVPLVITDYHLVASMNGLKLTSAIRQRSPDTRIVLITAHATGEMEEAAAAQGADFYLPKPFLFEDLAAIVSPVLAWWESRNQER
jgi:CheY-like chemotaxis protein